MAGYKDLHHKNDERMKAYMAGASDPEGRSFEGLGKEKPKNRKKMYQSGAKDPYDRSFEGLK